MVFVKFVSLEKRAIGMVLFNTSQLDMFDKISFMSPDVPIEQRVPKSFLIGFKNLLVSEAWGFKKSSVRFDEHSGIMSVGGFPVLKASVQQFRIYFEFLDPDWAKWSELTQDSQFQELQKSAHSKLEIARNHMDKGKGKGVNSA